jgi:flavin-binding protein dodecin
MGDDDGFKGESKESFTDAAKKAVKKAEHELGEKDRVYELTLRARGAAGSSLSDYIVVAKVHD